MVILKCYYYFSCTLVSDIQIFYRGLSSVPVHIYEGTVLSSYLKNPGSTYIFFFFSLLSIYPVATGLSTELILKNGAMVQNELRNSA